MSRVSFPDQATLIEEIESGDILEAIKEVLDPCKHIVRMDPDDYQITVQNFVDNTLPAVFKTLFALDKQQNKVQEKINAFTEQYITLTSKSKLSMNLLQPLSEYFDTVSVPTHIFVPEKVGDEPEKQIIKLSPKHSIIRSDGPELVPAVRTIIGQLFTYQFFSTTCQLIKSSKIVIQQMSHVLKIFNAIEGCLDKQIVSWLLPVLAKSTLKMLKEQGSDFEGMCHYISEFIQMLPSYQNKIVTMLCNYMNTGSIQMRFQIAHDIIGICKNEDIKFSEENKNLIKETLLKALTVSSNSSHLKQIIDFLPTLSKLSPFEEDDLIFILSKAIVPLEQRCNVIIEILKGLDYSPDTFGEYLLEKDNLLTPRMICETIGKIDNVNLTRDLFHVLLQLPEEQMASNISQLKINNRMMQHIQEVMDEPEPDVGLISTLSYFFLNAPHLDELPQFISNVSSLIVVHPQFDQILSNFASILNRFDSKETILILFNGVIESYSGEDKRAYLYQVLPVLTQWMESVQVIPEDEMFSKLPELSYVTMPNPMPPFLSVVFSKAKNMDRLRKLIMKIIKDTVPIRFSNWIISMAVKYVSNWEFKSKKICDVIMDHITQKEEEILVVNSIYMLKSALTREINSYKLGEEFALNFKIRTQGDRNFTFDCSLHPYQTVSKIYQEIVERYKIGIDKFQLIIFDDFGERVIMSTTPLSSITLDTSRPITIKLNIIDTKISNIEVPTYIINYLQSREKYLNTLFQELAKDYNYYILEDLFFMLTIFDLSNLDNPKTQLQQILLGKYDTPLDFQDNNLIFPYALTAYPKSVPMPASTFEEILNLVNSTVYNTYSIALIADAITKIQTDYVFSQEMIRNCLILKHDETLRNAYMSHFNDKVDANSLIQLIPLTTESVHRTHSEQFYQCFNFFNFPPETFVPFFLSLKSFEKSSSIDQTFISLCKLIPRTEETINKTFERLFQFPSVAYPNDPFLHSHESRIAAYQFVEDKISLEYLLNKFTLLPECPSPNQKLSDDFTSKGRCGITNLGSTCYINALLQSMNTFSIFIATILALQTDKLSPFLCNLRDFYAKLRYQRSEVLSIESFVETIPNFDAFMQEDAEEFLNHMINRVIEEIEGSQVIKDEIQGKIEYSICHGCEVFSTNTEDFYGLSLPTKDLSNLTDAFKKYFDDELIEGGYTPEGRTEKVDAFRRVRITRWPNCFIIQLQRWDYNLGTGERIKLVHEFGFPLELRPEEFLSQSFSVKCDFTYTLTAVVVHEGGAESGHYFALVRSEDDPIYWYYCDDDDINAFDFTNIPLWCFGLSDNDLKTTQNESVYTGYILFYKRIDSKEPKFELQPDLEKLINEKNEKNWESSVLYSKDFLDYAQNMVMKEENRCDKSPKFALIVYFKIAIVNDSMLVHWQNIIINQVLTSKESCNEFFNFIDQHLGKTFSGLVAYSDSSTTSISAVIFHALEYLDDSTQQIEIILKGIDFDIHKKALALAFELIKYECDNYKSNWKEKEELILLMIQYITIDINKENMRILQKELTDATEAVLTILKAVVIQRGCFSAIHLLYHKDSLNRLYDILKTSENFMELTTCVSSIMPKLITTINEGNNKITELLSSYVPSAKDTEEINSLKTISIDGFAHHLPEYVYSRNLKLRRKVCQVLMDIIDDPDPVTKKYIMERIMDNTITNNTLPEENTMSHLIVSVVQDDLVSKINVIEPFIDVLMELCYTAPFSMCTIYDKIDKAIPFVKDKDKDVLIKFMIITLRLIAYDDNMKRKVSEENVQTFFSLDYGSEESLQLILVYPEHAPKSVLLDSTILYFLTAPYSSYTERIADLIEEGIVPGNIQLPEYIELPNLYLLLALFDTTENTIKKEIMDLIFDTLASTRAAKYLIEVNKSTRNVIDRLRKYNPEEVDQFLAELNDVKPE